MLCRAGDVVLDMTSHGVERMLSYEQRCLPTPLPEEAVEEPPVSLEMYYGYTQERGKLRPSDRCLVAATVAALDERFGDEVGAQK